MTVLCGCGWFVDLGGLSGAAVEDAATDAFPSEASAALDAGEPTDAASPNPYRAAVLEDRPVSYWPFDDEVGSLVARDIVGGKTAVVNGKATFGAAAAVGTGVTIASSETFLEVGDVYDFVAKSPFTIEAWAQPVLDAAFRNIGDKRAGDGSGWILYFREEGTVQFEQRWTGGQRVGWDETPRAYPRPAHVVVTFDGSKLAMYLDNEKFVKVFTDDVGGPVKNGDSLVWGGGYAGLLDEVAIYDKALPPERISAHYKAAGR